MTLTPKERKQRANKIIHGAAASSASTSAALAQGATLGADTPIITAIAVGMVIALGELFGKSLEKSTAIAILGQTAGASIGVAGAKAVLGWFPGIGNIANATISFTYLEALGWSIYKYFEKQEKKSPLSTDKE